jgi:DNA repair and recombination protein RAD54B
MKPRLVLDIIKFYGTSLKGDCRCDTNAHLFRRKFTTKKNKTWEEDGILVCNGGYAYLQDMSGKSIGKCAFNEPLLPESQLKMSGKELEVEHAISRKDYLAGRPFLPEKDKRTPSIEEVPRPSMKQPAKISDMRKPLSRKHSAVTQENVEGVTALAVANFYKPRSTPRPGAITEKFKPVVRSDTVIPESKDGIPQPKFAMNRPDALVMKRPKECPKGKYIVDVVVDPILSDRLRPHQREGVRFLYECVMGLRSYDGEGALLADDMGLGKTLQTITLIWTLLHQNPIQGLHGPKSAIKKALVVCPVTLIENWRKEFNKWLSKKNLGVLVADQKTRLTDFTHSSSYSVMIIGYERMRNVAEELNKGGGIDLIIADEGHRLKTEKNKSAQAIRSLDTTRRIVLSGTPLQNDLSELFVMVDFINPGLLGKASTFKKEFETPIMKSRQPGATEKEKEKGEARQEELASLIKPFILRRSADVQAKYLPPKTEFVLFCKPTSAQAQVYQHILECPVFGSVLGSPEASLQLITVLKKVCNSPTLLARNDEKIKPANNNVATLLDSIPSSLFHSSHLAASSKMRVLDQMMRDLAANTTEKVVLVSNYTSTLDMLGSHLAGLELPFLRLDGSTPTNRRQDLVDTFNKTDSSTTFAFLLSAKSGGVGINLIGASRLVLFDVDWNPATDLQAMARIHRPGQKRPVNIYRFLMAGGMDEKIYQRQITKMGLADSVVDGKKNDASFSPEELRDLFRLDLNAGCQTHDLLGCSCEGKPVDPQSLVADASHPIIIDSAENTENESDDDDLPIFPKLTSATKYDWRATEAKILADKKEKRQTAAKGKLQSLMEFVHIDPAIFTGETTDVFGFENDDVKEADEALGDDVLVRMLKTQGCKVGFVFAKKNGEGKME